MNNVRPQLSTTKPMFNATIENKQVLTFGQKQAGLTLEQINLKKKDKSIKAKILFAQLIDLLSEDLTNDRNDERNRLDAIAIDEVQGTLRTTVRALTYERDNVKL